MKPGWIRVEQVATMLHAPLSVIQGLQEHDMLPGGQVMPVGQLRAYIMHLPWLRMLDTPLSESEVYKIVSSQLSFPSFGPAATAMSGRRYVKLYRVLAHHWGIAL